MNLTGKILTGLIFFLSIAFFVLALMVGNTHQNWKAIALENKTKVENARTVLNTFKTKSEEIKKTLNAERVARRLQIAQLESQLAAAQKAVDDKETLLRDEKEISQQALAALNNSEKRLSEQDGQIADLRSQNKVLVDDIASQRQSVVNLTNQIYKLKGDVDQLETMRMDLSEQLALKTKVMDAHGLSDTALTDHLPPDVEGIVLRTKDNLIAISVGGDDGVRPGHVFDIYRGDRFIGKAEVTNAKANISAAKLITEFLQSPVAEGDFVTTKYGS